MRRYEVIVIFDVEIETEAIDAALAHVSELVQARDGSVVRVDHWGKRPLAYEVRHRREGHYVVVELVCDQATVAELDRFLSLADEVVRFRAIRLPERVDSAPRVSLEGTLERAPGTESQAHEASAR